MKVDPLPETAHQQPFLQVVAGVPREEDIAALLAILAATSGPTAPVSQHLSLWSSKGRAIRPALTSGPGSWRASVMPR